MNSPRVIYVGDDISANVFRAVKAAVQKIHSSKMQVINHGDYLDRALKRLGSIAPRARRPVAPHKTIESEYNLISRSAYEARRNKSKRIKQELLACGATVYGLLKSETRMLPKVLHPNEHIEAVVYGQHRSNSVMLVATDERILYVDKKPMAAFLDEISYEVVSGIQFEVHTFFATLILHTPIKNYDIRFANLRCAGNFARHIEAQRLKKEKEKEKEEEKMQGGNGAQYLLNQPSVRRPPITLKKDLAGYYWLPTDEEESEA